MTTRASAWRSMVLRMSWDDHQAPPAVALPIGDFFCQGWGEYAPLTSELVVVAPYGGLNCYFPMPFRHSARVSIENLADEDTVLYYQLDYSLRDVPTTAGYFHAYWQRNNPLPKGDAHTIVKGVTGRGAYVGTYLAVGVNSPGWWGEGEVKFFIDEDEEFPTICGTGTEDYFGGAWDFDVPGQGYTTFSSNYLGLHQVVRSRWALPVPDPFRDVPLACTRPGRFSLRPHGHGAGPRVAPRPTVPHAHRRHCFGRLLVLGPAGRPGERPPARGARSGEQTRVKA